MVVCNSRTIKCISVLLNFGKKVLIDQKKNFSIFINKRNSSSFVVKEPWSVLFFGSDEFALESLKTLWAQYRIQKLLCRLEVVTAYKGKENCLTKYANENGIKVHQWPIQINKNDFDIGVVVSFGHLIPGHIINSFPLGMINVHASLLPRWRGSAPIIHALMNGDTKTGISIMKIMPKKFDVGDIIDQEETPIDYNVTQPELYKRLSEMGSRLLLSTIKKLPDVLSNAICQNQEGISYAPKIKPDICFVKWTEMDARMVYNLNRALTGLYPLKTTFNGQVIKLFDIQVLSDLSKITFLENAQPGSVSYHKVTDSLTIRCKDNTWVSIKKLGVPGKPKMSAADFKNGFMGGKRQKSCLFTS